MLIFLNPDDIVIPQNYLTVKHRRNTCEAIRVTGFIAPVVVRKEGEKYVLVDGYERLMCAKMMKVQVPAVVVENAGNILSFALNYVRGKYCGIDVLEAVRQLTEQYDMITLAKVLGRSYETVRRYRSVAEHLVSILSVDDYKTLREQCIPLKKILRCGSVSNREEFFDCLGAKPPKTRYISPELIKLAHELEKDQDLQLAIDLVKTFTPQGTVKLLETLDLMRKIVCPQWSKFIAKVDSDVYNTVKHLCDVIKV